MKLAKTIILIDDDTDDSSFFRLAMAKVCPKIGFRWLPDTRKLYEVLDTIRPFLIILDLKLAGECGIDCLRDLKKHPFFRHVPVILWSTSGIPANVSAAYEAGAQQYLVKPWKLGVLAAELKEIVRRNGAPTFLPPAREVTNRPLKRHTAHTSPGCLNRY